MHAPRSQLSARLRGLLRKSVYPLLCALSLAFLPYQPDNDPLTQAAQIAQGLLAAPAAAPMHVGSR